MTASSEDPTAEDASARTEQTALPLPRRSRGPSAIAEAAAALGSAGASEPGTAPDPESVPPPPMSAAAAEFAALTESAPTSVASGARPAALAGDAADGRADVASVAAPNWFARLPVRRRRILFAGAALAGVLVVGSAILVSGGDGGEGRPAATGTGADTAPDGGQNLDAPESSGSASPSGGSSALEADATNAAQQLGGRPSPGGGSPAPGANTGGTTATSDDDTKNGGSPTGSSSGDSPEDTAPATDATGTTDSADTVKGVLIRGHASGRCIDVTGGSSADHTRLRIWDCTGAARQRWQFMSDGSVRALGKCMDVDGGSRADGAWIKLVTCNGTGAQRFRLNAAYDLVNIQADKCVDVTDLGTANGTELQLWSCTGAGNQKWSSA